MAETVSEERVERNLEVYFLIFLPAIMALAILFPFTATGFEQDRNSIKGRILVEYHSRCITVHTFITNKTEAEISIITGAGGVEKTVVPTFFCEGIRIEPSQWKGYPRRDMKPEALELKPQEEKLYDSYTMGYPPLPTGEYSITGHIYFRSMKNRDVEYIVEFQQQKIAVPKSE